MNLYHLYVGTFTREWKSDHPIGEERPSTAEGIYRFTFDASSGDLSPAGETTGLLSPSWLATHPRLPVLYALERQVEPTVSDQGALASHAIDETTGTLELRSRQPSTGDSPCFVSVHPSGGHAYVTHYRSGHVASFPLDDRGQVGPADLVLRHHGSGAHPVRQSAAHPHQIRPALHGGYLTVTDLGLDEVFTYPASPVDGAMTAAPSHRVRLPAGTGPRHHTVHPDGRHVFLCGELSSSLSVLTLTGDEGELRYVNSYSTLPPGYAGPRSTTAEIVVHPSGRAIYVSNRGHDSIAVFSFDAATGTAEFLGTQPSLGRIPHACSIDPTGNFLLAANKSSGTLTVFELEASTLWPKPLRGNIACPSPSCLIFRPAAGGT